MERYLTPKATCRSAWELPAAGISMLMTWFAVTTWIEDSPLDEDFGVWLLAHLAVLGLMVWPLAVVGQRLVRRYRARSIAKKLAGCKLRELPLAEVDKRLGLKNGAAKIADLKRRDYLKNLEIDGMTLTLGDRAPEAPEAPETTGEAAGEAEIVLEIRRLNDEIDHEAVSAAIDRIERATAGILDTLEARPERAGEARRFMSYYLPTTLRLLESYRLMEKQTYQGENIQASRRQIEAVLDKLADAAERQQDKLYRTEALDVESDIEVLETMMAADGLVARGGGASA